MTRDNAKAYLQGWDAAGLDSNYKTTHANPHKQPGKRLAWRAGYNKRNELLRLRVLVKRVQSEHEAVLFYAT